MYVLAVAITFVSLATIAVALRLFTRIHLVCSPGWDDWILVISLLTDYTFFAFLIIENYNGLGKAESDIDPDDLRLQLKALWISIPLYNLTLTLTKVSMILLYWRIFQTRTYRILLMVVLGLVIVAGFWMFFSTLFICTPVKGFWNKTIEHHCLTYGVVWYLNAALQLTSDLIVVILPMPQIIRLQIPPRQKICLVFIFALGLFVCATSAVRLAAVVQLERSKKYSKNGPAAIWSFIEANVAIVCASLPTLRRFVIRFAPSVLPSCIRSSQRRGEKASEEPVTPWAPFPGQNTTYSADVSVSVDRDSHYHPDTHSIQVVSELRWDTGSAESASRSGQAPSSQLRSSDV